MFPKPDPFFSFTVSPHANQSPMKKPPKSCPVFQLAGDFDSDTSDGTARIRFPRTQSPSTSAPPGVQREVSAEKPWRPVCPWCKRLPHPEQGQEGFPGQLQYKGGDLLLILEWREKCAGKDWVVFYIWNMAEQSQGRSQRWAVRLCPTQIWERKVQEKSLGILCVCVFVCVCVCLVARLCLTLCDPMDCSPPGSSIHGISQGRLLGRVAVSFSRRIFLNQESNSCLLLERQILYHWATREAWAYLVIL